jgi:hypothetical protein
MDARHDPHDQKVAIHQGLTEPQAMKSGRLKRAQFNVFNFPVLVRFGTALVRLAAWFIFYRWVPLPEGGLWPVIRNHYIHG